MLIGILVVEFGCAPSQKIISPRTLTMPEVLQRVRERNEKILTLKGNGNITVESPAESNSGSFDVMLKKPDSLRVEFSGPFGIHVGTLTLSPEHFLFYNWRNNHAVTGKPDGTTLRSIFRLKMEFSEVVNAFTGEFPIALSRDSAVQFSVADELYVVKYKTDEGTKEYRIDGDAFVVTSYRLLDGDGKSIVNAFASRVDNIDTIEMPKLIRVIFPVERRSVTIAYDDIEFNIPVKCAFSLPPTAEVTHQ